jgi:hypothetical protein
VQKDLSERFIQAAARPMARKQQRDGPRFGLMKLRHPYGVTSQRDGGRKEGGLDLHVLLCVLCSCIRAMFTACFRQGYIRVLARAPGHVEAPNETVVR